MTSLSSGWALALDLADTTGLPGFMLSAVAAAQSRLEGLEAPAWAPLPGWPAWPGWLDGPLESCCLVDGWRALSS